VLSIEGDLEVTDSRRGSGVYYKLLESMKELKEKGIFFGASVTVTKENLHYVTGKSFVQLMYEMGCKVVIYVEYVPVNAATVNLALSDKERDDLDKRLMFTRMQYQDMIIVSFPGDEKSSGGCLAAGRGFFHINSDGSAEPCPFSPYSDTNVKDGTLLDALQSPLFLKLATEHILLREHTGGCVLFEQEEEVKKLLY
jgi:MoaA/NifB/PqqE/SkfB family radical SAM enzyme